MNGLSNVFSVLNLDAEDDKEQIAAISNAKDEESKKKNDGFSAKGASPKEEKLEQGVTESFLGKFNKPLVWIDLEMTGLNVEVDRILEIACIVTDGRLTKSVEGPDLVISQPKECLDNMGEWCREHHGASGLTKRVLQSTITERDAEKQVIEFIEKHIGSDTALLAGNSVYMDLLFLKKYMPKLAALLPHVLVDVSSIMALCIRWFPAERKKAPTKEKNHRAMDDIRESIRELKYYKESIFKGPGKSKR